MPIQAKPGEPLFINKQQIVGETLVVGTTQYVDRLSESEFADCTFDIVKPTAVMLGRCRLLRCVFRPRKKVSSHIGDNYWDGCAFHGHWEGAHFGASSDATFGPSEWPDVAVRGCDFSRAKMSGCRFCRLDVGSTVFPPWPCFTVLRPYENLQAWKAADLPFKTRLFEYGSGDDDLVAIMYHWPSVVKWYKMNPAPDPEEVRRALSRLDFVRL